jgi:ParB/RepB/Spo0J family partition protein
LLSSIPLDKIDHNVFNSRAYASLSNIDRLARSIERDGQLVSVRVRMSSGGTGKYELVYGHRRVLAAKKLGWKTIRAEVVDANDEDMLRQSLIENLEREQLSDYEKAIVFERFSREFNKTYQEIGVYFGISKQHVSNYLAMLRLFDSGTLSTNPELLQALHQITEHHGRILSRVQDTQSRIHLALLIARDGLSVRELSTIVGRLRSWFQKATVGEGEHTLEPLKFSAEKEILIEKIRAEKRKEDSDEAKVTTVLLNEFKLAEKGDFNSFKQMHMFDEGFSLFSAFPPLKRYEKDQAVAKERDWFYEIASRLTAHMKDIKIKLVDNIAVATLIVNYRANHSSRVKERTARGTVVLQRKGANWKILHEHWSMLYADDAETLKNFG